MNYLNTETNRAISFDDFRKLTIKDGVIAYFDIQTMREKITPFAMTSSEFKAIVKTFDYENVYAGMPKWSEKNGVERFKAIPFSYHYYSYVAKHGTPPSPEQYVNSYVKDYINVFTLNSVTYGKFKERFHTVCSNKAFILKNMKSRILRAYNSFNRELALLIMMQEIAGDRLKVIYDIHLDMDDGIDILVNKGNSSVGIATFVNSYKANEEKNRKRQSYKHNIEILDYAAEKSGERKNVTFYGDVMLYSVSSVREYVKELEKKLA
jgi:hypothetical protein